MLSLTRASILKRLVVYKDHTLNWTGQHKNDASTYGSNRDAMLTIRRAQSNAAFKVHESTANESPTAISVHQKVNKHLAKLDMEVKRGGRILSRDFRHLFDTLKQITPTSNQGLIAIRCCGSYLKEERAEKRNQYLSELWTHLQRCNVSLDISHYNSLLSAYLSNQFDFKPVDILSELQAKQISPNRVTYQRLLHKYCLNADMEGASNILQKMRDADMPINESVFNSLALGYCVSGDFETAQKTLDVMRESGVEPSEDTFTALLIGHISYMPTKTNASAIEVQMKVEDLLKQAADSDLSLNDRNLLRVISESQLPDNSPMYDYLLSKVTKNVSYNQECVLTIIEAINSHRIQLALRLLQTLTRPDSSDMPTSNVGQTNANFFIHQLIKANVNRDQVIEILTKFKNDNFNKFAFNKAAEYALQHSDRDTARFYLQKFLEQNETPVRAHYFWPILRKCQTDAERLEVITELYASLGTQGSNVTFRDHVWPLIESDHQSIIDKCKAIGFNPGTILSTAVQNLIATDRFKEAIALIKNESGRNFIQITGPVLHDIVTSKAIGRDSAQVTDFLVEFSRLSSSEIFSDFLKKIAYNVTAGASQLPTYLQRFSERQLYVSSDVTNELQLKFPDLSDDCKRILEQLPQNPNRSPKFESTARLHKSSDLPPHSDLNKLRERVLALCRNTLVGEDLTLEQRTEEIDKLVAQLEASSYTFTESFINLLISYYSLHSRNLEKALYYYSMLRSDFRIENDRVIAIALMHLNQNQPENALAILSENAAKRHVKATLRTHDRSKERVERTGHMLLQTAIEKDASLALYDQLLNALHKLLNEPPLNRWLGIKIKHQLATDNLDGALQSYYEHMQKYRRCPWKGELMRKLIEKEDSVALQKLSDESMKVHGETNILLDLSVAFLQTGREKQAKKILSTPGMRVFNDRIESIADNLIRTDNVDVLERFIEISKNLADVNRGALYLLLLRAFIARNDTQKALNVWTNVQEENLLPPPEMLHELGNYLSEKQLPIPFQMPSAEDALGAPDMKVKSPVTSKEAQSDGNLNLEFMRALRGNNLTLAAELRQKLIAGDKPLSLNEECSYIHLLINAGNLQIATDLVLEMLTATRFPTPMVIRTLLRKLASVGDWQSFERLEPHLPTTILETSNYNTNKLEAYMNSNRSDDFIIDQLRSLQPFPLVSIFKLLSQRPQIESKLIDLCTRLSQETDFHLPLNFIWLHHMLNQNYAKADELFAQVPAFQTKILYKTILEKVNQNSDLELCEKLVQTVNQTQLSSRAIGNVYNNWLKVLLNTNQAEKAERVLMEDIVNNENAKTTISEIDVRTLKRLAAKIEDSCKRQPAFKIPADLTEPDTKTNLQVEQSN